ncbi:quinoprotein relay system zinc metallohydrolase 1 [Pseudomonas sp. 148P]|uniref:Quinoprotein relay system zinc metallohydrolase 1 n=1 Tax=Pseudomonas ulcerans TaxID=3115852 RepID=A0ABU7HZI1_9PSED|nr:MULTISPECIES: quinoprotein relay system zinc metallohydrolase 1 [unclassified Pseudomonas]MEE1924988.1 quinoprotein relay system zinc metallohydrolase 1 [Pseudomonas sp. 147P]MEE1936983.1 quinoprotein relay system zinc metallohydrolase 1 [Pseudomonas sp. 148P]
MRALLCLLSLVSLPSLAALDYHLQPRQVAADTWVLEGSTENFSRDNGGNIVNTGFIVSEDGVVVIDSGPSLRYGQALREAIAKVTDKPVVQVLITHHHPDHALGNQAFADVPIGALAGTREQLAKEGDALAENMYRMVGDWMRGTEVRLPGQELEPGVKTFGSHPLRLLAFSGHSGADLAVLDEKTGVLFAGDLLFYQRALTTPHSPGLAQWVDDLQRLQGLPWQVLVPGHGPVSRDRGPFDQMVDYLGWLDDLLRDSAANGLDMNEVIATPIPERFAAVNLSKYELIRSVTHLYPRYEQAAMARVEQ